MNILLIGESSKDIFIYGNCERLNPEAPTPVFIPQHNIENDGMAGNVKNNIAALGYRCEFITNKKVCSKTRYVDEQSNYILLRVDDDITYSSLVYKSLPDLKKYDLVIISDYNKGLLSEDIIKEISLNSKLTFIDTKKPIGNWIKNCSYIKLNNKEYHQNKSFIDQNLKEKTIITLGSGGCKSNDTHINANKVEVRDVVGAGDTFLAALSIKYLESKNILESMKFANKCASEVVKYRGVTTPCNNYPIILKM